MILQFGNWLTNGLTYGLILVVVKSRQKYFGWLTDDYLSTDWQLIDWPLTDSLIIVESEQDIETLASAIMIFYSLREVRYPKLHNTNPYILGLGFVYK